MTEESYQQGRKFMQSCNYVRGIITKCKGEVAKWTKIEMAARENMQEGQANGAKKALEKAMIRLDKERKKFADMTFPDSNIVKNKVESVQCEGCGAKIAKGNTYCGECLCED